MFSKKREIGEVYYKAIKILFLIVAWNFTGFPNWFFKTLFVLYLMYPIFKFFWTKQRRLYYLLILLLLVMPFGYNLLILMIKGLGVESVGFVMVSKLNVTGLKTMYSIVYFLIGRILMEKEWSLKKSILMMVVGWGLVVVECTVYTNLNHTIYDGVNAAFPTVGALLLSVGVFFCVRHIPLERIKYMISTLSKGILSVYLMHIFVIKVAMILLGPIEHLGLTSAILCSGLIYLVCLEIGELLKRIPVVCCLVKM